MIKKLILWLKILFRHRSYFEDDSVGDMLRASGQKNVRKVFDEKTRTFYWSSGD